VLPILEYGDALWDGAQDYELDKLDQAHIRAMRIITGATERSSIQRLYVDTRWQSLSQRRKIHRLRWFYKILNNLAPSYLSNLIPPTTGERHAYMLRNRENKTPFRANRQYYAKFFPSTVRDGMSCQSRFVTLHHYLLSINT